ncbi:MAG: sugar ABC transporter substrate-binding protein [Meiothermus sp.]|nr:sugar ABC transporter substrate-binding protein [Meiothermus sp.]
MVTNAANRLVKVLSGSLSLGLLSAALAQAAPTAQAIRDFYQPRNWAGTTLNVVINASHTNPPYDRIYGQLRESFERASGAKVNFVPIPENEIYNKVRLALLAGQCPYDAMETGAGGAKDFGMSGLLAELPRPVDVADMFQGDVNQYSIDGKLYGMPMYSDTNILFWRTDLFRAAGLPNRPPNTYDEFRQWAIRLTVDVNGKRGNEPGFDPTRIAVYGSAFKGASNLASTWEWYNYLFAFGGDVFDDKYNVIVDSPAAVRSLQWVVDNFRRHNIYPKDTNTFDYTEFHTLFAEGRVAMAINWPYMWSILQDPKQSKVVGQVAVGRKPGVLINNRINRGGNIGGWSFNVFEKCGKKEAAIDLAKWFASPAASRLYAEGSLVPVRRSVLAELARSKGQPFVAISQNMPDGRMVSPLATGESWMPIENVLQNAIQQSLIGRATPQAALTQAAADIRKILSTNNFPPKR